MTQKTKPLQTKLHLYIIRGFLRWLGASLAVIAFIGFLGELTELLRINSYGKGFAFAFMLKLALYKLPNLLAEVLPFAFLLATCGLLYRLGQTNELLVARLHGLTMPKLLLPLLAVAFVFSLFNAMLISPVAAGFYERYQQERQAAENRDDSLPTLTTGNVWLYHNSPQSGYYLLSARVWDVATQQLEGIQVLRFDTNGQWQERWDAPSGYWQTTPQAWVLLQASHLAQDGTRTEAQEQTEFTTNYDLAQLQDFNPSARQLSFWQLRARTKGVKNAGLSASLYQTQWHSWLAGFLVLWLMIGLAGLFGILQLHAQQNQRLVVMRFAMPLSFLAGVLLFFLLDFLRGLGQAGLLAPIAAAWLPPVIMCLCVGASLWQLEDEK